ncbi:MAG: diguanylate cyclase [Desulfarculus sp.]|nr:diguanylate cyclase [Desulfarculus sp.]
MTLTQSKIMVVDDSRLARAALEELLRREGYHHIVQVNSGQAAMDSLGLEQAESSPASLPDLILLDIVMEGLDGIGLCSRIKAHQHLRDIPIIMLTAKADSDSLRQAFQAGAMDYVTKPYHEAELALRVRSALTLKAEIDRRKAREADLIDATHKLGALNRKLRQLSNLDGLTGISNRRFFDEAFPREWRRALRQGHPLAVLMIDIDHFKAYNDNFGHAQGDECLKQVARCLLEGLRRPGDLLARYGGEEFVVVLADTDRQGALVVAEALRQGVERLGLPHAKSHAAKVVTVSIGAAAALPGEGQLEHDLLAQADRALYRAKALSRNRVTCSWTDIDPLVGGQRGES